MRASPRSPQTSETVTRTIPCQCAVPDEDAPCEAEVEITATYYPRSYEYADLDGNRGQWVPGYFDDVTVGPCPDGCEPTVAEAQQMLDLATAVFADLLTGKD